MKYNGMKYTYAYIDDEWLFSFTDILTLSKCIKEIEILIQYNVKHKKELEWKKRYYMLLWNAILRWISSKYTMENYIDNDFWGNFFEAYWKQRVYWWLIKIRNSYLDLFHCFSNLHVWSPWKEVNECILQDSIIDEVRFYNDSLDTYEEHIKNISDIIWKELGEDIGKYISLADLKTKYGFNVNISEIQNSYFRF